MVGGFFDPLPFPSLCICKLVEGMMAPERVFETVEIVKNAIEKGMLVNLIINNRAGGNAPLIAREIAMKFLGIPKSETPHPRKLWDT